MAQNDKKLCLLHFISQEPYICRLLTAKFQSARGASHQPAFVGSCLIISHTCFPCPPSRWISPCVLFSLMIWLIVVLLMFFLHGEYHFSSIGVDTILGNESGIQWQNYGAILQESEMTAGFHNRNWISNLSRWTCTCVLIISKLNSQFCVCLCVCVCVCVCVFFEMEKWHVRRLSRTYCLLTSCWSFGGYLEGSNEEKGDATEWGVSAVTKYGETSFEWGFWKSCWCRNVWLAEFWGHLYVLHCWFMPRKKEEGMFCGLIRFQIFLVEAARWKCGNSGGFTWRAVVAGW